MIVCKGCNAEVLERPSGQDICDRCGELGEGDTFTAYECPSCEKVLPEDAYDDEHSECRNCQQGAV